jgi:hypothetical protein
MTTIYLQNTDHLLVDVWYESYIVIEMIINLCRLQKTCIQIHKKLLSEICVYYNLTIHSVLWLDYYSWMLDHIF